LFTPFRSESNRHDSKRRDAVERQDLADSRSGSHNDIVKRLYGLDGLNGWQRQPNGESKKKVLSDVFK